MKVEVRAWLGGGCERIDFSGDVDRIDPGCIKISSIFPQSDKVLVTYFAKDNPMVDCVIWRFLGVRVLKLESREPSIRGNRPVYDCAPIEKVLIRVE